LPQLLRANSATEDSMKRQSDLYFDSGWLPTRLRMMGWAVTGVLCAALAFATFAFSAPLMGGRYHYGLGTVLAMMMIGIFRYGLSWERWYFRRSLLRKSAGAIPLASVAKLPPDKWVCVKGRVRIGKTTVKGVFSDGTGAFQRVRYQVGEWHYVHESAEDFSLCDDAGATVLIDTSAARLLHKERTLTEYSSSGAERLKPLGLPAAHKFSKTTGFGSEPAKVKGAECLVRDGDSVVVWGVTADAATLAGSALTPVLGSNAEHTLVVLTVEN